MKIRRNPAPPFPTRSRIAIYKTKQFNKIWRIFLVLAIIFVKHCESHIIRIILAIFVLSRNIFWTKIIVFAKNCDFKIRSLIFSGSHKCLGNFSGWVKSLKTIGPLILSYTLRTNGLTTDTTNNRIALRYSYHYKESLNINWYNYIWTTIWFDNIYTTKKQHLI